MNKAILLTVSALSAISAAPSNASNTYVAAMQFRSYNDCIAFVTHYDIWDHAPQCQGFDDDDWQPINHDTDCTYLCTSLVPKLRPEGTE